MKCKKCNFGNPDNIDNCKKCGTKLIEETDLLPSPLEFNTEQILFSPGENFGQRYQIIEEIGRGGMGKVFKAKDKELNIVVALKMIKPELSSNPDIVSRFKRELLLAREIFHENVIRIHDLGEIDNIKYISMNYIKGNSLSEIIESTGKLTIEKSVEVSKQICNALIAAHSKGIIHRDLKPQNIMIDKKGNAFVLDFGIARSITSSDETAEGFVVGTPNFMSPEQIRGEKADISSDVYSLGIIIYEMITGKLPFSAENPAALLQKHLHEKPPLPSSINPQIPKKLELIIMRCLEKKKKLRYESIEELLDDLEHKKTSEILIRQKQKNNIGIKSTRQKGKKDNKTLKNKLFSYTLRTSILLGLIYIIISIVSVVNDSKYGIEIEKIKVEYETYYKNSFPIQKDWITDNSNLIDSNAWDKYLQLFSLKKSSERKNENLNNRESDSKELLNLINNFKNKTTDELVSFIQKFKTSYNTIPLIEATRNLKLAPEISLDNEPKFDTPLINRYLEVFIIKSRIDFLQGDYEKGLTKIYHFMIFAMDLLATSTTMVDVQTAIFCFSKICQELIPLYLSKPMLFYAHALQGSEELINYIVYPIKIPKFIEPDNILHWEIIEHINSLITRFIAKLEFDSFFYKIYLNIPLSHRNIPEKLGINKTRYHLIGKLKFWKYGFSLNNYFYKTVVLFYKGMIEGLKYIKDIQGKKDFLVDYLKKPQKKNKNLISMTQQSIISLNLPRMIGKLAIIISTLRKHGINSIEFESLKKTNSYINDFSGKIFEIKIQESTIIIVLKEDLKLKLRQIDYQSELQSLLAFFNKENFLIELYNL